MQEVKGDPEAALVSLLTADRLHSRFDAINLNLALLYHKLAETAPEPTAARKPIPTIQPGTGYLR